MLLVAGYWLLVTANQRGKYFIIQVSIKKIAANYELLVIRLFVKIHRLLGFK